MGIIVITVNSTAQIVNPMNKLKGNVVSYDESMYMYNDGIPSEMTHGFDQYTLNDTNNSIDHAYLGYEGWNVERHTMDTNGFYIRTDIYETYTNEYTDEDIEHKETYTYSYDSSNTSCTKSRHNENDTVVYEQYVIDPNTGNLLEEKIIKGIERGTVRTYSYNDSTIRTKGIDRKDKEYFIIEYKNSNGDISKKEIISDGQVYIQDYTYTYDEQNNWIRCECVISSMPVNSKSMVAKDHRKAHYKVRSYTYAKN